MALRLRGATSGYIELKAPASAGDNTLTLPVNNGSANQILKTDGNGNLSWVDDANTQLTFANDSNNRVITGTGSGLNAEANLTFDGSVLDVVGNVDINNGTGQAHYEISQTNGNTVKFGLVSGSNIELSGSSNNDFYIKLNGDNEKLRVLSNGDVGVGITTPTTQSGRVLHLHAGAAQQRLHMTNDTTGSAAADGFEIIVEQGTNVRIRNFEAGALMFDSGGANNEAMRIDSSGRLLVGTTTEGFATYGDKLTIADSGHCGMTIRSGNSNYGTIYFSDNNDGSADEVRGFLDYNHATNILQLGTDGGARISISPTGQFNFNYKNNTAPPSPTNGGNEGLQIYATREDNSNFLGTVDFVAGRGSDNTNGGTQMRFFVQKRASGTNPIESLRINRTGNVQIVSEILCIGASTNTGGASSADFGIEYAGNVTNAIKTRNTHSGDGNAMVMITGSTEVGSIVQNTSNTAYNTSSDYRLKENQVEISDGITRLKTLKPYRFNWKVDPTKTVDGFFAHEVTAVPEAIKGTKDEVASEDIDSLNIKKDDPIYQQIDQSKLVPLITAALKEAIAKIETLETKVAALESA